MLASFLFRTLETVTMESFSAFAMSFIRAAIEAILSSILCKFQSRLIQHANIYCVESLAARRSAPKVEAQTKLFGSIIQCSLREEELVLRIGARVEADDDFRLRDRVVNPVVERVAE